MRVPAFIAAIREDGEVVSKRIIPVPVPPCHNWMLPFRASRQINISLPIHTATITPDDNLTIGTITFISSV